MNKILKNTLTGALSLCLLAGCGLSGAGWTQASAADMAYLTAFAAQHSEVRFAFPQSARYVDGI